MTGILWLPKGLFTSNSSPSSRQCNMQGLGSSTPNMRQLFRQSKEKYSSVATSGTLPVRRSNSKVVVKDGTTDQHCSEVYFVFLIRYDLMLRMCSVGK